MILYFNHQYFNHPTIQQAIVKIRGHGALSNLLNLEKYSPTGVPIYTRKGTNSLPFKTELIHVPGFAMPDYNPAYNNSWDNVTDQRCMSLRDTHFDLPWLVMWSGGIDSTNIVAALVKNLPPSDLANITVACTPISIWENPHFYFDYIKPNFKVVNTMETLFEDFNKQDVYVIDGEPADQLFGGLGGMVLPTLFQNLDLLNKDIIKHSEYAIDFIANHGNQIDRNFAEWYYHALVTSAQSVGVPVNTLQQLIWWSTFNDQWIMVKFRFLAQAIGNWRNVKNAKPYVDRFLHWYDSNDYQQWAMNEKNVSEKLGTTISSYKLAAKKYIYSLDKNEYYFKFKTKVNSYDIFAASKITNWCCIDQDWNMLTLEDNADQIINMLPDHLV